MPDFSASPYFKIAAVWPRLDKTMFSKWAPRGPPILKMAQDAPKCFVKFVDEDSHEARTEKRPPLPYHTHTYIEKEGGLCEFHALSYRFALKPGGTTFKVRDLC